MKLRAISRHWVKGLRPESIQEGRLIPGRGLEGDRAFAFQFLDESIPVELREADAESAPWMSKFYLTEQHDWPELARVMPEWHAGRLKLSAEGQSIEESVSSPEGRNRLAEWLGNFLRSTQPFSGAKHPQLSPLRLIGSRDLERRYTDGTGGPISLMSDGTLHDLQEKLGVSVDWRVFRLNLMLEGVAPWTELGWKGKRLRIGECEIEVLKPIARCANIDVDPESGRRGPEIFHRLRGIWGHAQVGMRADIIRGGVIRNGDEVELLN